MSEANDDAVYKIASSDTPGELAEMVNELMAEGWIPQGGLAVATDSTDYGKAYIGTGAVYGFYQAMVRPKPETGTA